MRGTKRQALWDPKMFTYQADEFAKKINLSQWMNKDTEASTEGKNLDVTRNANKTSLTNRNHSKADAWSDLVS